MSGENLGRSGADPMVPPGAADEPHIEPLFDLDRLALAVRSRRRMLAGCAVAGFALGVVLATTLSPPPQVSTLVLITADQPTRPNLSGNTTDAIRCQTAEVASIAAAALGVDPVALLAAYTCRAAGEEVVAITVGAAVPAQGLLLADALGKAVVESRRIGAQRSAAVEGDAALTRRAQAQRELADVIVELAAATAPARTASLLELRKGLVEQIDAFSTSDQDARAQASAVAARTRIIDPPRLIPVSAARRAGVGGVLGLVLGTGAGLGAVLLSAVVRNRPVRRQDVARAVGAPVLMELPRRGVRRRRRGQSELAAVAAALGRLIATAPGEVALLELGRPGTAAKLADRLSRMPEWHRAAPRVASLDARPGWAALREIGRFAVVVVRAGGATEADLRAAGRDLARAEIDVLGVVLIDAHPKDYTDGVAGADYYTALAQHRRWLHHLAPPSEPGTDPAAVAEQKESAR